MGDHQVPMSHPRGFQRVDLHVGSEVAFAWTQIAGDRVVTTHLIHMV
jgi:hypothetical protein